MAVIFDGANKLIVISVEMTEVNVRTDIYSAWKEWVLQSDNAKFLPALRTTGGDPVGGGVFTGDVYFLINGWRVYIDHSCAIDGIIYSDDYPSPFVQVENTFIVTNKVAAISSVTSPTVTVDGLAVPTAAEIRTEIDTNSTKLQTILTDLEHNHTEIHTNQLEISDNQTVLITNQNLLKTMMDELNALVETTKQNTIMIKQLSTDMYCLLGLDPIHPVVVTKTTRTVASITQQIDTDENSTVLTRI